MSSGWIVMEVVQSVMITLLVVVLLALARQIGIVYRRMPPVGARVLAMGPAVGDLIEPFSERGLDGGLIGPYPRPGRRLLLVFISSGCGGCADVAPALRSIARSDSRNTDVVLASHANDNNIGDFARRHSLASLPLVISHTLPDRFGVSSTPYALMVDELGRLRGLGLVNTLEHLESLINIPRVGYSDLESLLAATADDDPPQAQQASKRLLQIDRMGKERHE